PEQRAGVACQALGLEGIEPRPDFLDGVGYGKPQHLVGFLRGETYAGRGYEMTLRFHEESAAKRPLDALGQGQQLRGRRRRQIAPRLARVRHVAKDLCCARTVEDDVLVKE